MITKEYKKELTKLYTLYKFDDIEKSLIKCGLEGNLEAIQYMSAKKYISSQMEIKLIDIAIETKNNNMLNYMLKREPGSHSRQICIVEHVLSYCFEKNKLDILKFLIDKYPTFLSGEVIKKELERGCYYGSLDCVRFIVNHTTYKKCIDLRDACRNASITSRFNIVQYLCASNELEKKVDIAMDENFIMKHALEGKISFFPYPREGLQIIKFLLTSSELKEHVDIHAEKDMYFKSLIEKELFDDNENQTEIINFLVFDYKIKETEEIKNFIKNYPEIEVLFKNRDLNSKLKEELKNNKLLPKKVKI